MFLINKAPVCTVHPAEYVEQKVYFVNPKGEKLVGLLVDTGSEDVVILCHG
jgi:hypothetical protein